MMTSNQINQSLVVGLLMLASTAWALPDDGKFTTTVTDKRPTACQKDPEFCKPSTPPGDPAPVNNGNPDSPVVRPGANPADRPAKFEGKTCNELKQQEQSYLDKVKVAAQNLQDSKDRKAALEKEMTNPLLSDSALNTLGTAEQQACTKYNATREARLDKVAANCGDTRGKPCRPPAPTTDEINQQTKCENATNENRLRRNELQTLKNGVSNVGGDIRDRQKTWAKAQQDLTALRDAKKNACQKP